MKYIYAITAGLISSTAFEPFSFWPSAFIGLAIWYLLLTQTHMQQRLVISYLYGLALLLPVQHWTGIYVGSVPWILLCFMQALFFIVPAFFIRKGAKFNQLLFACSYVLVEALLRTIPFTGFGWSRLSFTQVESVINPAYAAGGVVLIAFLLAFISACRSLFQFIFIALLIVGASLLPQLEQNGDKTRIALIQGGVVKLGLDFNSKPREVFLRHLNLTAQSLLPEQVDLVIWPENAVDIDINRNQDVKNLISDQSEELKTPILAAGVSKNSGSLLNQSYLFSPDLIQTYTKRYLTPFGEYIPLRSLSRNISPLAAEVTDFEAGKSDTIFNIRGASFQTLICYEILDDTFRDHIKYDFLVVQSNNATFGDTAQLDQQLNIARVRALETGRSIAYASTTGITAFINSEGKIESNLAKFDADALQNELDHVEGLTLTQLYGKYLEYLALTMIALVFLRRKFIS